MMLRTAQKYSNRSVLYLHLTRDGAKGIVWPTLKALNEKYGFKGNPNESDLTMTLPNGAVIALRGVDKRKEIEKRRGYGFALVVLDECQSIPEYVRNLVDEVIAPALADVPGRLIMIGTPSLLESGYWYECHHNLNPVWGHFSWTMWDNPHIPDPDQALSDELERRGITEDNVSIQREWMARWLRDAQSAVFAFEPAANCFGTLPEFRTGWNHVIAIDLGGGVQRDNDAIVVLSFNPESPCCWLTEEHVDDKQDVTAVAEKTAEVRDRLGAENVVAIVCDTGGIGAKVALEMRRRHRLEVVAANKADKWANIEMLNAACRHRRFFARPASRFATEAVKVEKDWDKSTPDRIVIKGHMPDVCDGVLYGYVEALHWLYVPEDPKPKLNTAEGQFAEQQTYEEQLEAQIEARKNPDAAWMQTGEPILDDGEWP